MATEAVGVSSGSDLTRPYPRSWLDLFFGWMTALPGQTWLAYAVLLVPSIALSHAPEWLSGLRPWGELDAAPIYWGVSSVAILGAAHYLGNLAGSSFDRFRPALGNGVSDPERVRYELTVMPAVPVAVLTIFVIAITPLYFIADPVASQVAGMNPAGLVARTAAEGLTSAIFLAVAFQALRQLRIVTRLHAAADQVDPFRPLPLYAFSRLAAQVGIVLILFISGGVVANPAAFLSGTAVVLWLPWLVGTNLVAVIVFLVPMLGMHGRLVAEKDRLESTADGRMRALLGELNEAIDARATDRVDALDRTISALRHEREILSKLPTWPWSTGTIRGFGSALLLPIALFLVQRALSAALGD